MNTCNEAVIILFSLLFTSFVSLGEASPVGKLEKAPTEMMETTTSQSTTDETQPQGSKTEGEGDTAEPQTERLEKYAGENATLVFRFFKLVSGVFLRVLGHYRYIYGCIDGHAVGQLDMRPGGWKVQVDEEMCRNMSIGGFSVFVPNLTLNDNNTTYELGTQANGTGSFKIIKYIVVIVLNRGEYPPWIFVLHVNVFATICAVGALCAVGAVVGIWMIYRKCKGRGTNSRPPPGNSVMGTNQTSEEVQLSELSGKLPSTSDGAETDPLNTDDSNDLGEVVVTD